MRANFSIVAVFKPGLLVNNFNAKLLVTVSNQGRPMTRSDYFLTKHLLTLTFH